MHFNFEQSSRKVSIHFLFITVQFFFFKQCGARHTDFTRTFTARRRLRRRRWPIPISSGNVFARWAKYSSNPRSSRRLTRAREVISNANRTPAQNGPVREYIHIPPPLPPQSHDDNTHHTHTTYLCAVAAFSLFVANRSTARERYWFFFFLQIKKIIQIWITSTMLWHDRYKSTYKCRKFWNCVHIVCGMVYVYWWYYTVANEKVVERSDVYSYCLIWWMMILYFGESYCQNFGAGVMKQLIVGVRANFLVRV